MGYTPIAWFEFFFVFLMVMLGTALAEGTFYEPLPEMKHPAGNPFSKDKEELGKMLFFDPRLSGRNWISCATCYNPALGWGDAFVAKLSCGDIFRKGIMMNQFFKFLPGLPVFFVLLVFSLVYVGEAWSGPGVRHGLRQSRHHDMHHGMGHMGKGSCPQPRATASAPDEFLKLKNPLKSSSYNVFAGESFFQTDAQPTACKVCHGLTGNGMGMMALGLNPPPRNFTCAETMKNISDGQMFWIIKKGSHGTGMPKFTSLKDEHIWQVILYLRTLVQ